MIKRFHDYLTSIGMKEKAFLSRVDTVLPQLRAIFPETISDILVEEVVQEDGTPQYLHLIAFSTSYIGGVNNFLSADEVTVTRVDQVNHLTMRATSFDLVQAKPKPDSRIYVQFAVGAGPAQGWALQGSGVNCAHIWRLTNKHIKSRL